MVSTTYSSSLKNSFPKILLPRLGASAAIVTWVATGGNPGSLLGVGGERSLKRPDMAEKEAL